ncbi:MAG: GTP cyclohydrolase I FolE2 [Selenomonadaceae bacterium]|nr:GTP cyclohydrolase I FolE2 [Selenomonadaceae bacterium]
MIDVQNQIDDRGIKIQRTGISGVYLPLIILNQNVLAKIKFTVALNKNTRGTHMSRLAEILTDYVNISLKISDVEKILRDAIEKLETNFSAVEIAFKFFVKKIAPVSERESLLDIDCKFVGELSKNSSMKFILNLAVPFTSLCPCSKEISDFGAHNQRSVCRVQLEFSDTEKLDEINIFEIVDLIESQGSSKIFPILKREDEKFVTETAYKNPKFVEDILRDIVLALREIKNLSAFEVECENFESIHNHSAFAFQKENFEK